MYDQSGRAGRGATPGPGHGATHAFLRFQIAEQVSSRCLFSWIVDLGQTGIMGSRVVDNVELQSIRQQAEGLPRQRRPSGSWQQPDSAQLLS